MITLLKKCWLVWRGSYWMSREGPWEWCCYYHRDLHDHDYFFTGAGITLVGTGNIKRINPKDFYIDRRNDEK